MFLKNVPERPEPEEIFSGDPSRELATLHHICATHKEELQNLSLQRVSLLKNISNFKNAVPKNNT